MTNQGPTRVVAIAGGSGAGKTWLAKKLLALFGDEAASLSLDDFYKDRSHLSPARRGKLNFDTPHAIDWPMLRETLCFCREGRPEVRVPGYNFKTHTRTKDDAIIILKPIIIVEGLWLFHRQELRELFDIKIFLECSRDLRFTRRMERDVLERGRTAVSVTEQFKTSVLPMHERHVEPQARWADEVICSPLTEEDVIKLAEKLKARRHQRDTQAARCNVNN